MANTLTAVTPKLLAQGLLALRQECVMPRLVNRQYDALAGQKGSTVDVPVPAAITAVAVSPSNVRPVTADITPSSVSIAMDQWYEAPFYLTDKDLMTAMEGTLPMQASEAVKALANNVDSYLLGMYKYFYGWSGTAGTTPFALDTSDATNLRKELNKQLAPKDDRHVVFDPDAEASALNLRAFQDASWSGSIEAILSGNLNEKLGFRWWMDQNVPTHTPGVPGGTPVCAAALLGATTLAVTAGGAAGTYLKGDIITIAGHSQTYVVTANLTLDGGGAGSLLIYPGLVVALAGGGNAITLKASHVANMGFHRDAIAFANRPLVGSADGLGAIIQSAVDPVSGLVLRLEISREHKQTRFSYDILYGAAVVRRELGARLAG